MRPCGGIVEVGVLSIVGRVVSRDPASGSNVSDGGVRGNGGGMPRLSLSSSPLEMGLRRPASGIPRSHCFAPPDVFDEGDGGAVVSTFAGTDC